MGAVWWHNHVDVDRACGTIRIIRPLVISPHDELVRASASRRAYLRVYGRGAIACGYAHLFGDAFVFLIVARGTEFRGHVGPWDASIPRRCRRPSRRHWSVAERAPPRRVGARGIGLNHVNVDNFVGHSEKSFEVLLVARCIRCRCAVVVLRVALGEAGVADRCEALGAAVRRITRYTVSCEGAQCSRPGSSGGWWSRGVVWVRGDRACCLCGEAPHCTRAWFRLRRWQLGARMLTPMGRFY